MQPITLFATINHFEYFLEFRAEGKSVIITLSNNDTLEKFTLEINCDSPLIAIWSCIALALNVENFSHLNSGKTSLSQNIPVFKQYTSWIRNIESSQPIFEYSEIPMQNSETYFVSPSSSFLNAQMPENNINLSPKTVENDQQENTSHTLLSYPFKIHPKSSILLPNLKEKIRSNRKLIQNLSSSSIELFTQVQLPLKSEKTVKFLGQNCEFIHPFYENQMVAITCNNQTLSAECWILDATTLTSIRHFPIGTKSELPVHSHIFNNTLFTYNPDNGVVSSFDLISGNLCAKKQVIANTDDSEEFLCFSLLRSGKYVAFGTDNFIQLFSSKDFSFVKKIQTPAIYSSILSIAFSNDDEILYCGTDSGVLLGLKIDTNQILFQKKIHTSDITDLNLVGNNIYSCSSDETVKAFNLDRTDLVCTYGSFKDDPLCSIVDGKFLYACCSDSTILIFSIESGKLLQTLSHDDSVWSMCVFESSLYTSSGDSTIKKWSSQYLC